MKFCCFLAKCDSKKNIQSSPLNSSSINQTTTKPYRASFKCLRIAADKKHNNYEEVLL